ncbi:MAG TPA: dihydropteroate synthase [Candidatus Megaira endosymbiont of Hartmannula sinica]|nr:dihydropteroate synthase [Candidatus Megaera endosymbiont of Hartmannula sinica]
MVEVVWSWWVEKEINKMLDCGFLLDDIIIDPGIGFGKNIYQNIDILRIIKELKSLGVKIFIGHSRKSFMSAFMDPIYFKNNNLELRDLETIAISSNIISNLQDCYIRVHNICDHQRFFVAKKISDIY